MEDVCSYFLAGCSREEITTYFVNEMARGCRPHVTQLCADGPHYEFQCFKILSYYHQDVLKLDISAIRLVGMKHRFTIKALEIGLIKLLIAF